MGFSWMSESDKKWTVSNSGETAYGNKGVATDEMIIKGTNVTLYDAETYHFAGKSTDYTYQSIGGELVVKKGDVTVARFVADTAANKGETLHFNDGSFVASGDATTGSITLNNGLAGSTSQVLAKGGTAAALTAGVDPAGASTEAGTGTDDPTPPTPGQTFTLTAKIDTITPTESSVGTRLPGNGDDTFKAGSGTLNAGDELDGGGGTNVLKIYDSSDYAAFANASIKNIEIVEGYGTGAVLDVSGNADVKEVWAMNADTDSTNANLLQKIGLADALGATAEKVGFKGVNTTNDSATIMLKDAGKTAAYTSLTVNNDGGDYTKVENLTIETTGKNQLGNLVAASMENLIITGTGSLNAVLLSGTGVLKSVDSSTSSVDLTLSLTDAQFGAVNPIKVTTGSGKDVITFTDAIGAKATIDLGANDDILTVKNGSTAFTTGSTIKGGAGADTLVLDTTTAINATTGKMFESFETIKLSGTSEYHVGDIAGITAYEIGGNTAVGTITNLADKSIVTVSKTATAILTLNDNTAATASVTLNIDNGADVATAGFTTTLNTSTHVVNVVSGGLVSDQNAVTATGDSLTDTTNFIITGDQAMTLSSATKFGTQLTLVDASGMTDRAGKDGLAFTLTDRTTDTADTLTMKGSAGNDKLTVTADAEGDVFTFVSNGGDDAIVYTATTKSTLNVVEQATTFADTHLAGSSVHVGGTSTGVVAAGGLVIVGFSDAMAGLFKVGGVTLANSAATEATALSAGDSFGTSGTNIHFTRTDAAGATIQIDINGDGFFNAADDYQVTIVGNADDTFAYANGNFTFTAA